MKNAMLLSARPLSASPGRPREDSDVRRIGVHPVSGDLLCPCCEGDGDLDFWQEADREAFVMKVDAARIGQPGDGPHPVGAIYCYECCQDWEVPPWMCLVLHSECA